jgi:hypothetical protein
MMSNPPLTLDAKALARLLSPIIYKSENTILRDVSRRPESLPPFEELGGPGGKKIFETQVVIDFYPPGIGVAIRRSLEREWGDKDEKSKRVSTNRLPPLRTLAEDLMAASASAGRA